MIEIKIYHKGKKTSHIATLRSNKKLSDKKRVELNLAIQKIFHKTLKYEYKE